MLLLRGARRRCFHLRSAAVFAAPAAARLQPKWRASLKAVVRSYSCGFNTV